MRPKRRFYAQPRRRPRRNSAARRRGAATAAMAETTGAGMAATGLAAGMKVEVVMVGVATLNTAVEEVTAAEEARLVEAATREAARTSGEVTEVADAVLGEAAGDDGTAHGVVPLVTAQPSARPPLQVRTAATSRWRPNTGKQLLPWWMLHLRQQA